MTELHALPSLAICVLQAQGELIFEKYEHYQKRSFRNRYLIRDSNGIHALSIPLRKGKNNQLVITEVEISYNTDWIKQHLQSIQTAYGKSPYYNFYKNEFIQLFSAREKYLWNWNLNLSKWLFDKMNVKKQFQFTSLYRKQLSETHFDFRNKFEIKDLQFKSIVSINALDPFYHNLNYAITGLDLLFNYGPESNEFLLQIDFKKDFLLIEE